VARLRYPEDFVEHPSNIGVSRGVQGH
jgi:hypothetical protein